MTERKPLLSICVPTYNRSKFLRVMLQALLPQAAEFPDQVEVWILDNASPDDTPAVVEQSRALGPFRSVRNAENIGPVKNVVMGPAELATGEFVWVLGDHNILMPGALQRLLEGLALQRELDLFYVNFRCATYPDHWPNSAHSGYAGPCSYIGNLDIHESSVPQWSNLIKPSSALCTQIYAHVVRTSIWRDYWLGREIGEPYTSGQTTYPHTWMIASTCISKAAGCVSEPVITIFNGAQSWTDPLTQLNVYLRGLPELIALYQKGGVGQSRLNEFRDGFATPTTRRILHNVFQQVGFVQFFRLLLAPCVRYPYLLPIAYHAFVDSNCNTVSRVLNRVRNKIRNHRLWWIYNCRPARWCRGKLQRNLKD
jgi:hypothetical protein